ncbi:Protein of unknown function DUF4246 [Abortiporus biennis]
METTTQKVSNIKAYRILKLKPGIKIPTAHDYDAGFFVDSTLISTNRYVQTPPAKFADELRMLKFMQSVLEKPNWYNKLQDTTIRQKWIEEAKAQLKMREVVVEYALKELDWYASSVRDDATRISPTGIDFVWKSDNLIEPSLHNRLLNVLATLQNSLYEDYHPQTLNQIRNVIHPSLFCLVYDVSRDYNNQPITQPKWLSEINERGYERIGAGDYDIANVNEQSPFPKLYSHKFQWLPSEFLVDEHGDTKIGSYINGLSPFTEGGKEAYLAIAEIFKKTIPLFEKVLTGVTYGHGKYRFKKPEGYKWWPEGYHPKHPTNEAIEQMRIRETSKVVEEEVKENPNPNAFGNLQFDEGDDEEDPDYEPDSEDGNGSDSSNEDYELDDDDYHLDDSDSVHEQYIADNNISLTEHPTDQEEITTWQIYRNMCWEEDETLLSNLIPLPIPEFKDSDVLLNVLDENRISLRGVRLQVITKISRTVLTPEQPDFRGGKWHIEGMANESIVATAIYYFDSENIQDDELRFKQAVELEETDFQQYDDAGVQLMYNINYRGPLVQELGGVSTPCGRVLAFPNIYQHCLTPFTLKEKSKPGHRTILVFFLVDPTKRITSTLDIPPQQIASFPDQWVPPELLDDIEEKLPVELRMEVMKNLINGNGGRINFGLKEAEEFRLELMKERRFARNEVTKEIFERPFALCEH